MDLDKNLHQQQQFEMKDFDEDQAPSNGSSSHSTTSTPKSASRSQSSPRYYSSNSLRSDGTQVKIRSLKEIYEVTQDNDDDGLVSDFALFSVLDPICFEEAIKYESWKKGMDDEIEAIEKKQIWQLVNLPEGKDAIGVKWVYKTKFNEDGNVVKHKARLVAKGFSQQCGIDYNETFSPVARLDTLRIVLAITRHHKWKFYQMDVKSTFLNGILQEEVYVQQPPSYQIMGHEQKV